MFFMFIRRRVYNIVRPFLLINSPHRERQEFGCWPRKFFDCTPLSRTEGNYNHEPATLSVVKQKFSADEITFHFDAISKANVFQSLMIMIRNDTEDDDGMTALRNAVTEFERGGMLFHLITVDNFTAQWYQVLKVKHISQGVVNPVRFDRRGHIVEDYNMQGMKISSVDLDWPPFFMADGCDQNFRKCKAAGADSI